jgi:hypothetical protein
MDCLGGMVNVVFPLTTVVVVVVVVEWALLVAAEGSFLCL